MRREDGRDEGHGMCCGDWRILFFLGTFFRGVVGGVAIFIWGKSMPSGWMLSSYFLAMLL